MLRIEDFLIWSGLSDVVRGDVGEYGCHVSWWFSQVLGGDAKRRKEGGAWSAIRSILKTSFRQNGGFLPGCGPTCWWAWSKQAPCRSSLGPAPRLYPGFSLVPPPGPLFARASSSNRWFILWWNFWEKARRVGKLTYPSVCWIWPSSKSSGFYARNVLSDIEFQLCQEITTLIRSVPLVIFQEKPRNLTSQLIGSLLTHWLFIEIG